MFPTTMEINQCTIILLRQPQFGFVSKWLKIGFKMAIICFKMATICFKMATICFKTAKMFCQPQKQLHQIQN